MSQKPHIPKLPETVSEVDVLTFERQQREMLYELHRKRISLDECRQELNEAILKQQELERLLSAEKRKRENDDLQHKLMINATQALEEERQEMRKNLNVYKVQLEIITSERDTLRDQIRALQMENIKYKRKLEDYEAKQKCHSVFQSDISEQQARLRSSILHLSNMMQSLKKDQETLRKLEDTNELCAELEILGKQHKNAKEVAVKQRDELENECITKTAELSKLKDLVANSPLITMQNEQQHVIEYWKNGVKELKEKLAAESESSFQLTEALKLSNETQMKLEEREQKALKENEELIRRLNELNIKSEKVDVDCQTEDITEGEVTEDKVEQV